MAAQAGIYFPDRRPIDPRVLDTLCAHNRDLGPDRTSLYVTDGLAMLSFAVHFDRLATEERQPVQTLDGAVLTWDGRLDNRDDFASRLQGDVTHDRTDACLMGLALSRWGDEALGLALGDWTLVQWHPRTREVRFACDYVGDRPLYYVCGHDYVAWSTSAKPLVRLCALSTLDEGYFATWLVSARPPLGRTHYRGLSSLLAGQAVRIGADLQPRSQVNATLREGTICYRSRTQYEEHYRHVLLDAVRARLRAHQPAWIELSGGYDSSTLTCLANGLIRAGAVEAPALQPISSVLDNAPDGDERPYIASVEAFCGIKSNIGPHCRHLPIEPEAYEVPPYRGIVRTPLIEEVVQTAGGHVLLSGQFGDAITAHIHFVDLVLARLAGGSLAALARDCLLHCRARREHPSALARDLLRRLREAFAGQTVEAHVAEMAHRRGMPHADVTRTHGLRPAFVRRAFEVPPQLSMRARVHTALSAAARPGPTWGVKPDLVVRGTYPFLARPVVEFINAVPPDALWSPAHPREFHLSAWHGALPHAVVHRGHKLGTTSGLLRDYQEIAARAVADLDRWLLVAGDYADPTPVRAIFDAFLNGMPAASTMVFRLLAAESLLQQLARGRATTVETVVAPASRATRGPARPSATSATDFALNVP